MTGYIMATKRTLRRVLINLAPTCCTEDSLRRIIVDFVRAIRFVWVFIVAQILCVLKMNHLLFFACGGSAAPMDSQREPLQLNSLSQKKKAVLNRQKVRQGGRL
jgi:hypothetical protein